MRATPRPANARISALVVAALMGTMLAADDWPGFRGPDRDGISREAGLLLDWPADGPTVLWRRPLGEGYSGIAVVGDLLYTMFANATGEFVAAWRAVDGTPLWTHRLDERFTNGYGNGPRATPTVAGGIVYAHGARSQLAALSAETGNVLWQKDLVAELDARVPRWGASSSPLIEGNLLIVNTGSETGAVVALRRTSGDLVWKSGSDLAGYSSPVAVTIDGRRQILALTGTRLSGLAVEDGEELWTVPWRTSYNVNATTPVFVPPNRVLVATGYNTGGALFQIDHDERGTRVTEIWRNPKLRNQFSSAVVYEGGIYGFDNTTLRCVDLASGEELWAERGYGHGSLTIVDGHLLVLSDRGTLLLAAAHRNGFEPIGSATLFQGKTWTVPTYSEGRLYARDGKELLALDLRAAPANPEGTPSTS